MPDAKTRVFNVNGRRLVSFLGREDFPGERMYKLPTKVIEFASRQPLTSSLLPCRVGYFPRAEGQKVVRPNGDWAFTLLFCMDGEGRLSLANSEHRLRRGTCALLRPFEFHSYEADAKHPWSYYWIHFNGTMAQQYYEILTTGGKSICIQLQPDENFVRAFEGILAIFHDGNAYRMLVQAAGLMHQLLSDLYALIAGWHSEQESNEARIGRTLEVMRHNLGGHISIKELAALANMSPTYYAAQFRRHTGETPRSYFNRLRIQKACEHLASTTAKIESIAHEVGCEDAFYFCRLFKRLTGQTPTQYRHEARRRPAAASSHARATSRKKSVR